MFILLLIFYSGIGCKCRNGWRVIQDVGNYRRNEEGSHGGSSGSSRERENDLKCEVSKHFKIFNCLGQPLICSANANLKYQIPVTTLITEMPN